jgi:hypothetical protein
MIEMYLVPKYINKKEQQNYTQTTWPNYKCGLRSLNRNPLSLINLSPTIFIYSVLKKHLIRQFLSAMSFFHLSVSFAFEMETFVNIVRFSVCLAVHFSVRLSTLLFNLQIETASAFHLCFFFHTNVHRRVLPWKHS